ncbi:MAG: precorrin-6Y C5,15-methyltransferase (decarboxylating) subunit CbiT [Tindallia sp. MSAO_Bac2]|nr:MAG: precorrin-6Y C5,15-methyltransferase (decarboxylating) subunit CbiT [Tindallia sp. MSAO_Bac2]
MTKQEIRWIALAMLQIQPGMTALDLGCGSGSLTVEMARMTSPEKVYAMEHKKEALEVTRRNLERFRLTGVNLMEVRAEDRLQQLPALDRVFIGGSGGALEDILCQLTPKLKPDSRIVMTAVTLETIAQAKVLLQQEPFANLTILQTGITRYVRRVGYNMAQAENPVMIFGAETNFL